MESFSERAARKQANVRVACRKPKSGALFASKTGDTYELWWMLQGKNVFYASAYHLVSTPISTTNYVELFELEDVLQATSSNSNTLLCLLLGDHSNVLLRVDRKRSTLHIAVYGASDLLRTIRAPIVHFQPIIVPNEDGETHPVRLPGDLVNTLHATSSLNAFNETAKQEGSRWQFLY